MDGNRKYALVTGLGCAFLGAASAEANIAVESGSPLPRTQLDLKPHFSENEPISLLSERLDYDHEHAMVTASGKVEVAQGETVLLTDALTYDQKRKIVKARGHVVLMDAGGNVLFADEMTLTEDLKAGVIRHFKARMHDESLFAAAEARRFDEEHLDLFKAVYSPCECDRDRAPQWQLKSHYVNIDETAQKVTYDNAYFEAYGVPIFYTPYLSHPTPNADNQSGLLMPEYQFNENLGSIYTVPYYYSIAPDKDITLAPMYTGLEGLVMQAEYRQKFDSGAMQWDGSITRPQDRDPAGIRSNGNTLRGHINGEGNFALGRQYAWGFDLHRSTDDTYLRRYGFADDTLLTSKVYMEGFNFVGDSGRNYGSITGLAFQGLTAQDNQDRIPLVLPLVDFSYETKPGAWNSRFSLIGNMMSLTRDLGPGSRRMSATLGWKLPYITDDGQMIAFETRMRTDVYSVSDVALSNGRTFDGTAGRMMPEAELLWHYPFINRWDDGSLLLGPVVSAALSPNGGNPREIPNEDSLVPEFTDTNLFSSNRFPGFDRVESGPRLSYGLRGQLQAFSDYYVDGLVGQSYRAQSDRFFPFSNELSSHASDYVGRITLSSLPWMLAYRFRLDRDSLSPKRTEVDSQLDLKPIVLSAAYLSLKDDPVLATKEEIVGSATVDLTREWAWTLAGREDLLIDQVTSVGTGFMYKNECTSLTVTADRAYTRDRDVKPATNFLLRIAFKNLN